MPFQQAWLKHHRSPKREMWWLCKMTWSVLSSIFPSGTYSILNQEDHIPAVSDARLKINEWSSDEPGLEYFLEAALSGGSVRQGPCA